MAVDRTRPFRLPGIQDLSKDQDEALALPRDGQRLMIGGPGTGKSVVCLLRARQLARADEHYLFLVYNRLLDQSNRYLFGNEQPLNARTWDKWFRNSWRQWFDSAVPTKPAQNGSDYRAIDWDAVAQRIQALPADWAPPQALPRLIIDEGQDMPPAFYDALANLGFEHFYVAADQNQQIHPDTCSSRQDIQDALGIEGADALELTTNYRNTRPIARLAWHFYSGDPASPPPKLPLADSPLTPMLFTYGQTDSKGFDRVIAHILQLSDREPKKLIGIIAPNNKVREQYYAALKNTHTSLDNGKPPIQTYAAGRQQALDFSHGGIMVINAQSCKGLEFDVVFLADINQHQPKADEHTLKARFYVMAARARERIILLRTGDICPVVDGLLPADSTILDRK